LDSAEEPLPTLDLGVAGWCLRPWRSADAASLARHADDVDVWRWMSEGFPHPYTIELAEHWVARGHVDFGGEHWAIAFDDQAVGGAGVKQLEGVERGTAEVGWWLGRAYWGQGIASRVARALVRRAFENPALKRVVAPIHAGNERSMRVARNAGMTLAAVQRQGAVKAGQLIDRHVYQCLREPF
jgi:ribosomal-protein-alanine N-acetyltransferase